ncbi:phosphocarrier protein [Halopolyspora algeriensis]|uniref:Phosphocarrier protein HPr n=1 Tax=Halopolyspora algeriensis TaxID=1500506 RepID=A0A368VH32_9ACTN|nr:HPr family phosphocarrier protein [Halopolyspora algeriensis]RCW40489.1 phosphocarrier protein [Halopolyspora algeriensis]TQM53772.1 phosphocarrier protein [Halopolyspora algeriensis]
MPCRRVTVAARVGIHARPATLLSQFAGAQEARVSIAKVENGVAGEPVDAASVLGLMTLGAEHGDEVEVCADGPGEQDALEQLAGLLERDVDSDPAA